MLGIRVRFAYQLFPSAAFVAGMSLSILACSATWAQPLVSMPSRIESNSLPNAYRITPDVISGGQPDGEAAYQELSALGVKTIISVDGAAPNVATALRYGLRTVHIPHGYDGISRDRVIQLAKALRDLPGPFYIHCHHGKHRSPTAAAVACVATGRLQPKQAVSILRTAGTSPDYQGLYATAQAAQEIQGAVLDAIQVDFPGVAKLPAMAEAMVALEHIFSHLQAIEKSNWKSPADHPDLKPAHEALLLKEHYTEMLRTALNEKWSQAFVASMSEGLTAAEQLEELLRDSIAQPQSASAVLQRLTANCKSCHRQFRDQPLVESISK